MGLSFMSKTTFGDFTKMARDNVKKGGLFSKVSHKALELRDSVEGGVKGGNAPEGPPRSPVLQSQLSVGRGPPPPVPPRSPKPELQHQKSLQQQVYEEQQQYQQHQQTMAHQQPQRSPG